MAKKARHKIQLVEGIDPGLVRTEVFKQGLQI